MIPAQLSACCSPLMREPLTIDEAERIAPLLKALAEPVAIRRVLSLVASHADGEAVRVGPDRKPSTCRSDDQPPLRWSHEVGCCDRSKRGVWVYYTARREALADIAALIGGTVHDGRGARRLFEQR